MADPDPVVPGTTGNTSTATSPSAAGGGGAGDDDGRTVFARLVGVLLLLFPPLLVYFLVALWPRPVCDIECKGIDQPSVCPAMQADAAAASPAAKSSAPATTPAPASTPESTPTPTPTPADTAGDSDVAQEIKRLNQKLDDEAKQWAPCAALHLPFLKKEDEEFRLAADVRLLLLVMIAGALGAYVHAAQSYTSYLGNQKYKKQWTWWYVLRIPVGSALALFLYFTTRGGLLTGTTPPSKTDDLNIFGIMSFAALAGLFSKQLIDKLGEVFSNFFKSEEDAKRKDKFGYPPSSEAAKPGASGNKIP